MLAMTWRYFRARKLLRGVLEDWSISLVRARLGWSWGGIRVELGELEWSLRIGPCLLSLLSYIYRVRFCCIDRQVAVPSAFITHKPQTMLTEPHEPKSYGLLSCAFQQGYNHARIPKSTNSNFVKQPLPDQSTMTIVFLCMYISI